MTNHHVSKTKNSSPEDKTFEPRPLSNTGATKRKPGNRFHISTMTPAPLTTLPSGVIAEAQLHIPRIDETRVWWSKQPYHESSRELVPEKFCAVRATGDYR